MGTIILDARQGYNEWNNILSILPYSMQDIYFTPDYIDLHILDNLNKATCFIFTENSNLWIYPFILRTFNNIGNCELGFLVRDIESAYGYGGPLSNCTDKHFLFRAHSAFKEWSMKENIIAEFVRLHPLLGNEKYLDPEMDVSLDRNTCSLNLIIPDISVPPFDSKTNYMLRRASKSGVRIKSICDKQSFHFFVKLYIQTMDRLEADKYYYFTEDYFSKLFNICRKSGLLLAATIKDDWVAAGLFLKGNHWLHYHLSAWDAERQIPGIMNLLIWEAAKIGHAQDFCRIHLGGGRSRKPDDTLFRFKFSMSTDRHSFLIAKRILNEGLYRLIFDVWNKQFPGLADIFGNQILCYHKTGEAN